MRRYSVFRRAGGLLAVLALFFPVMFAACGAKEPPPAPPAPKVEPAPAPVPVPEPKAPEPVPPPPPPPAPQFAPGPVVPVTLPVLKLMPESGMMTLAIPPLTGIQDKLVAFAKRIAPGDFDVDAEIAKAVSESRGDVGAPDAKTLADIIAAKGIQPDAPIGVYVDLTPTAASAKEAFASINAELEAQKAAPAPAPAPAPKEGEKKDEAAPPPPPPTAFDKALSAVKLPSIAAVFGCSDPAKAETTIKELLGLSGGALDPGKAESIDVNGVQVKCVDPEKFAYAIADNKVFASNSLSLLKEVLARVAAPAAVRYGSVECPAEEPDELVLLTRFDKFAPLVKDLLPALLAMNKDTARFANTPLPSLEKMLNAMIGDDPGVTTLVWTDKKIELKSAIDNTKHPAYAALSGEAKPLRLAPMLPDSTVAMLSLRFNEEIKASFRDGWLNALPPEVQKDAGLALVSSYINQAIGLIGDEVTLGIASANGGVPQAFLMASLAQADQVKGLIQMFAPMTPATKQDDVEISIVAVPLPVPVYIAFAEDTMMLANDIDRFKELITAMKAKTPTKFLTSLEPPIDPAAPLYSQVLLKTSLVSDIVKPLAGLAGGIPPVAEVPLDRLTSTVRELRLGQGIENNWHVCRLTIHLK